MSEFTQQATTEITTDEAAAAGTTTTTIAVSPLERAQQAQRAAYEMFRQSPDWVTFFREILGVDGVVRKMFPNPQEMNTFEQGEQYAQIQQMLAKLRERAKHPNDNNEPTRVITVRLPKSLHESLRHEAHERKTSMNQLCISKLLQIIDNNLVPKD
jgi:predicted HicB family RNase H-like nuclease